MEIVEELASPQYRGLSGMHVSPEGLLTVRTALQEDRFDDALSLLGDQWHPPSLADLA